MSTIADQQTIPMSAIRAWWEKEQRAFLDKFAKTHDFDFCPLHGFWKLGQKKGGLFVATCPSCPSLSYEELTKLAAGAADV